MGTDIKNQGFNIVGALLEFPQALIAAGFVVKNTYNHVAINIFAAAGPIL